MIEQARTARERFAGGYVAALREFVGGAGEVALLHAYELGRVAALEGIGVIEIAELHHEALAGLVSAPGARPRDLVVQAGQLLGEALSTHEITLRSYRANARLLGLDQNLAEKNAEIDRARQQLTTILDATTAVIYLKGADGRYLFVNRAFQEIFGVRRADVIGRADDEVLPAPAAEVLRTSDARVLAERTPRELEETVPERDGPHTFLSLKFPLLDDGGAAYGVCCVATDITERKRAEEALRRASRTGRGGQQRAGGVQLLGLARPARAAARHRRLQPGACSRTTADTARRRGQDATCGIVRDVGPAHGRADRRPAGAVAGDAQRAPARARST